MQEVNPEVAEVLSVMDRMVGIPLIALCAVGLILVHLGFIDPEPPPGQTGMGDAVVAVIVICIVYWLSRFFHWAP